MITLTVTLTRQDGQVTTIRHVESVTKGERVGRETLTVVNAERPDGMVHRVLLDSLAAVDLELVQDAEPSQ